MKPTNGSPQQMAVAPEWIRQTSVSYVVVLMYHRIQSRPDPLALSVSAQNFAQHLQVLRSFFTLLSPAEFASALAARALPKRAVLITFDDGYKDVLTEALPSLRSVGASALAFVCGDAVASKQEFWWDALQRYLLQSGSLPGKLQIDLRAETYLFDPMHASKESLFQFLIKQMPNMSLSEQTGVLAQLEAWIGVAAPEVFSERLEANELKQLSADGRIVIGGHSTRHLMLSQLSDVEQHQEIMANKQYLELVTGSTIDAFAYPYGSPGEFNQTSATIVQDCGFKLAFAAHPEVVWPGTSPFLLPRLLVRDCNGLELKAWLESWF